jgi:hypothetical protein
VGWAKDCRALPGYYTENGKRYVDEWDAEKNPMKDCAKLWLKFLRSKKHFPVVSITALEHSDFCRLPSLGRQGAVSAAARGAVSRMDYYGA